MDTLACAHALNGDFTAALTIAKEVTALDPSPAFKQRLERFKVQRDCSGLE